MNQKFFTAAIVFLSFLMVFFIIYSSQQKKQADNNKSVLFYGNTCPHCQELDEWLKANNIETHFPLIHKEVYQDKANAGQLGTTAQSCGLNTDSIVVPFLYSQGQCFIGKDQIIEYLNQRLNQ